MDLFDSSLNIGQAQCNFTSSSFANGMDKVIPARSAKKNAGESHRLTPA
jgi:hypothetical protein